MIFKRKEYDTFIGKISHSTLKNNPDMIKNEYERIINKLKTDDFLCKKSMIMAFEDQIKISFGEYKPPLILGFNTSYIHTDKSKKMFKVYKKHFLDVFKTVDLIKEIEKERDWLLKLVKYNE